MIIQKKIDSALLDMQVGGVVQVAIRGLRRGFFVGSFSYLTRKNREYLDNMNVCRNFDELPLVDQLKVKEMEFDLYLRVAKEDQQLQYTRVPDSVIEHWCNFSSGVYPIEVQIVYLESVTNYLSIITGNG